eukprot:gnl/TRDRNA2_/TRDRNA2_145590_c2_seq2.p1 gnl/TRDRNA2_/TRDRNA2_145590_c2~~gnl/TRDRNA2_/TRDRNA2_145590_c2_seq2.p1  ORF type:complete len:434 (-),score=56.80 gnl/TRDRNA2_/TRDRNA2_145590_c2_seq2:115-1416(-)
MIQYDPGATYITTALRMTGTVVPHTLSRVEFWLFFGIHLLTAFMYRQGYLKGADHEKTILFISWHDMQVISAITTFFEVFYSNQSFARYTALYEVTRKMLSDFYGFVYEVSLFVGPASKAHVRLATRFFLCSVLLFFFEMNGEVSDREWGELLELGLVKPEEVRYLTQFNNQQRSMIMLHWSGRVTRCGHALNKHAPANALKTMLDFLLAARHDQQVVLDSLSLQIPFPYFHLLNCMITVNMLLWAYGMGVTDSLFSPFVYFFSALIFMGMMELAAQLADPFGTDEVDFPLNVWMSEVLANTATLIEYEYGDAEDSFRMALAIEEPMSVERQQVNILRLDDEEGLDEAEGDHLPSSDNGASGYYAADHLADRDEEEPVLLPALRQSSPSAYQPLEPARRQLDINGKSLDTRPVVSWTEAEYLDEPRYQRWRFR